MAEKIKGIVVEIGGDATELSKALRSANSEIKRTDSELKDLKKDLKLNWDNATFRKAQESARKQVEQTADRVDLLKKGLKELEKSGITDKNVKQFETLKNQLEKAEKAAAEARGQIEKIDALKLEHINQQITKLGAGLSNTGKAMLPVTAAAVTGMTAATKNALEFGESLATVSTIADETQKSMETIGDEIIEVSNRTNKAATEIADATYQAISSGVDTANATSAAELASKAAIGGLTDAATAMDAGTTVLNAYKLEFEDLGSVYDKFIVAQNYGKTTFGEMGQSIGQVVPIAAELGVSIDVLLAQTAALTKQGIQTSSAMTGLKAAYANIIKPTAEASKMAEELGIEFSSSALKAKGFTQFIEEIKTATNGNTDQMAKLFGSVEALNTMLALTGKGAEDFDAALLQMEQSAGAADAAFNKIAESDMFKMKSAMNELKNASIELGGSITPIITALADKVSDLAKWFSSLDEVQQKHIITLVGVAAAMGPVLIIFGKLTQAAQSGITSFQNLTKGIAAYKAANEGASTATAALNTVMKANPAALVATAIIALTAAVVAFISAQGGANREIQQGNRVLKEAKKAVDDVTASTEESITAKEGELNLVEDLIPRIEELNNKEKRTGEEQAELNRLVEQANGIIPNLIGAIDAETGSYDMSTEAIYRNIAARRAQFKAEAIGDITKEIYRKNAELERELDESNKRLEEGYKIPEYGEDRFSYEAQETREEQRLNDSLREQIAKNNELLAGYEKDLEETDKRLETIKKTSDSIYVTATGAITIPEFIPSDVGDSGVTSGSKSGTSSKTTAKDPYSEIKSELKFLYDMGEITEAQYYDALRQARDKYLAENSSEWRSATVELHNYQKKAEEAALKELQEGLDKRKAAIEEYHDAERRAATAAAAEKNKAVDAWLASEQKRINGLIENIDKELAQRERLKEKDTYDKRVERLQAAIDFERDENNKIELQKELQRLREDREEQEYIEQKRAEQDALRKQLDEAEAEAERRRAAIEAEERKRQLQINRSEAYERSVADYQASIGIVSETAAATAAATQAAVSTAANTVTNSTTTNETVYNANTTINTTTGVTSGQLTAAAEKTFEKLLSGRV